MIHRRLVLLLAFVTTLTLAATLGPPLAAEAAPEQPRAEVAKDATPGAGELPPSVPPDVPDRSSATSPGKYGAAKESYDPAISTLVARSERSDTYKNDDGTTTLVAYGVPTNYKDATGSWKRLDTTLKPGKADKAGRHVATDGPVTAEVADKADDSSLVSLSGPGWSLAWSLAGAAKATVKIAGSKATFTDVAPGTDLEEQMTGTGVKETIVLKQVPKASDPVSWRFPLRLSGLTPATAADGTISFTNDAGEVVLRIPPGVAVDSSTTPRIPIPASTPVALALEGQGATLTLVASVDRAWLVDPARIYPVRVDPSFDAGNATWRGDAFGSSYSPNANFNGSAQWDGYNYLNAIGYTAFSWSEYASYLNFDVWPINGKRVLSAQLRFFTLSKASANHAVSIYPLAQAFSESGLTWNNRPNHYADTIAVSPPVNAWAYVDMTSWAVNWASGAWGRNGLAMDTGGRNEMIRIAAAESAYQSTAPAIYITYNDPPPVSNPISPSGGAILTTTQPTLSTTAVADPEGNTVQYFYRVRDAATGAVAVDSGWLTSSSWGVPGGRLSYGRSYRWEVFTWDGLHPVAIGPSSQASFQIASEVTGAPGNVVATRGDTMATVTWSAPSLSVPLLTSYTVHTYRASDNVKLFATPVGTATSATVTGLKNGTAYYFRITAINIVLPSPESSSSNTVTPAGVPFAPTGVIATRGDSSATVTWLPPATRTDGTPGDNGAAISGYTVTASPGGAVATSTSTTAQLTGLSNGANYTFAVRATNAVGAGPDSPPSNVVVPAGRPLPPSDVTAEVGNRRALVTWLAPNANGSPITGYVVTAFPGGASASSSSTSATVFGLTAGTSYTFSVVATNSIGSSPSSEPSSSVIPYGPPTPPTNVAATATGTQATVSWTPSSPNGSPVSSYTVTAAPGEATSTVTGSPATIMGLAPGTSYSFTVVATNAYGSSAPSLASNSTTTAGAPASPGAVTASGGNGQATVTWSVSDPNGSPLTQYKVKAAPGGRSVTVAGTDNSAVITDLENGTSYTFTVEASNAVGTSSPSSPSNAVWPLAGGNDGTFDKARIDLFLSISPDDDPSPIPCIRIVLDDDNAVYTCRRIAPADLLIDASAIDYAQYVQPGDVSGGGNYIVYVGENVYEGCRFVESSGQWRCRSIDPNPSFKVAATEISGSFTRMIISKWAVNQATIAECVNGIYTGIFQTRDASDIINNCS